MGQRDLKRVPLDFNWPLNQAWKGYLNPYSSQECTSCDCSGLNPATKKISDDWYSHSRADGKEGWGHYIEQDEVQALVNARRLMDFTHTPRTEEQREIVKEKIKNGGNSWLPESNGYIPTADEVNAWSRKGFGHDAINRGVCVEARATRLGVYGECEYCNGHGVIWQSEEIKQLAENWEYIEPPEGEGWQLWEATSEGSPVSPVFESAESLAVWCEDNATLFGSEKANKDYWLSMFLEDKTDIGSMMVMQAPVEDTQ